MNCKGSSHDVACVSLGAGGISTSFHGSGRGIVLVVMLSSICPEMLPLLDEEVELTIGI